MMNFVRIMAYVHNPNWSIWLDSYQEFSSNTCKLHGMNWLKRITTFWIDFRMSSTIQVFSVQLDYCLLCIFVNCSFCCILIIFSSKNLCNNLYFAHYWVPKHISFCCWTQFMFFLYKTGRLLHLIYYSHVYIYFSFCPHIVHILRYMRLSIYCCIISYCSISVYFLSMYKTAALISVSEMA